MVVQGARETLLGRRDAERMQMLHIGYQKVQSVKADLHSTVVPSSTQQVLAKHQSIFNGIGCLKNVTVNVKLEDDARPVACRATRVPVHLRPALEKELLTQLEAGIIETAEGPTPWVSRIVVVPKSTPGEVRVTMDLRNLNSCTKREHQPIPNLDEQLIDMGQPRYFSYIDGNKMFHQLQLDDESAQLMAFATGLPNWPLMRYRRMVMGWCNASSRLQQEMRKLLAGLPGILNIGDDLAVYGDTLQQHDERLDQLLTALEKGGVTAGRDKCRFAVAHIGFMGLLATRKGLQPPEDKVKAVQHISPPKDKSEVRSFMGLVQFLSRFIPNLASIAEPIQRLTRSKAKWQWEEEEKQSFALIKQLISAKETLVYFDSTKKTELRVDAGPCGLGAILAQVQDDGGRRPVAYASRTLSSAERNYSHLEKEALAVKWGCEKFNFYLEGSTFDVITDHRPLLGMLKPQSRAPPRIERWLMNLQHLNFRLRYDQRSGRAVAPATAARKTSRGGGPCVDFGHI